MMKRKFILSVLCLCLYVGFSQTPVIDTIHTNKCALSGVANSEIILIDNSPSQANITSRTWTIADANQTIIQIYTPNTNDSISHLFSNPGNYTIKLSVSWNNATPETDSIIVNVYPQSIPAFESSADSILFNDKKDTICANDGGYLYLQDKSSSPRPFENTKVTKWEWKMGSVATDTVQNPTLQSNYAGLYDLTLKITNEYGCTADSLFYDQVMINNLYAYFKNPGDSRPSGSICNKTATIFKNESQVLLKYLNHTTYLSFEWDWGDGDTSLSYGYAGSPIDGTHTYDLPDLVNKVAVKLRVTIVDPITRKSKECSVEYEDTVIVTRPIADFTTEQNIFACPQDGIVGGTGVTFNDQSEGDSRHLRWNFGDTASGYNNQVGPGSPEENRYKNPSHIYRNPGKYNVLLIAQDINGCIDSMFKEAYIYIGGPIGKVSYSPTDGCAPITVTFDFTVSQDPEFMPDAIVINTDGAFDLTMTGNSPFFHPRTTYYSKPGKYRPFYTLYKTVVVNGVEEVCKMQFLGEDTIYVVQLVPFFDIESSYYPGVPVTFENITIIEPPGTPVEYIWAFGNGDTTYTYNEGTTQYDSVGNYTVTLTVNAGKICSRSLTRTIKVVPIPPNNVFGFSKENETIKIYPNPTAGNLIVEFIDDRQRYIQILDANARILYQQIHHEQIIQVSLENYPVGTYTVIIDNTTYQKFIIVK